MTGLSRTSARAVGGAKARRAARYIVLCGRQLEQKELIPSYGL